MPDEHRRSDDRPEGRARPDAAAVRRARSLLDEIERQVFGSQKITSEASREGTIAESAAGLFGDD